MRLFLFFLAGLCVFELRAEANDLIEIYSGDLPIVLSAPHGGSLEIEGVPERKGQGVKRFVRTKDMWTDQLTVKLADSIEKKTGKRPYVVVANFHRKFIDANRSADLAYESPKAKPVYDSYHRAIASARREVLQRWGRGMLFDVHGQAAEAKAIFRGTQNGQTTSHLVGKFGQEALSGEKSVFGLFAKESIAVIPDLGPEHRETRYTGGYIVRAYGSSSGGAMDAIQLEFGRELRLLKNNDETARKVASAIVEFSQKYLPAKELTKEEIVERKIGQGTRVGVYQDIGSGRSLVNLLEILKKFDNVTVQKLMAADIQAGALADVDVLIHPGGSGGKQGRNLGEVGREKIRRFLHDGGGFIGICAGAYLASVDYSWSLDILDAKVIDRKHWARGTGTVVIGLSEEGFLNSDQEELKIFYGQGPLLAPGNKRGIEDYHAVATFKTEIAKNGAPKGVMVGTTAIAQGKFGQGRVVCFSPHPEMTEGLDDLVRQAIEHVRRQ